MCLVRRTSLRIPHVLIKDLAGLDDGVDLLFYDRANPHCDEFVRICWLAIDSKFDEHVGF